MYETKHNTKNNKRIIPTIFSNQLENTFVNLEKAIELTYTQKGEMK